VRVFGKYPSFQKAKVVRDKRTNKTKGFGFVSFKDPQDFIKAMKEMNGKSVMYTYIYFFFNVGFAYIAQKTFLQWGSSLQFLSAIVLNIILIQILT